MPEAVGPPENVERRPPGAKAEPAGADDTGTDTPTEGVVSEEGTVLPWPVPEIVERRPPPGASAKARPGADEDRGTPEGTVLKVGTVVLLGGVAVTDAKAASKSSKENADEDMVTELEAKKT